MGDELRLEVPYNIWRCERQFRDWLAWHEITEFFWEVDRYDGYVLIEVFN